MERRFEHSSQGSQTFVKGNANKMKHLKRSFEGGQSIRDRIKMPVTMSASLRSDNASIILIR